MPFKFTEYSTAWQISLATITILLPYIVYFGRRRKARGLPPGPTPLPMIGNLHQLGLRPYETFMTLGKKYGQIFSVDYASFPAIVLNNHETIRKLFNDAAFSGRPKSNYFQDRTGGEVRGIFLTELEPWIEQRRFLVKNLGEFGFGKKTMENQIMEAAQRLILKIKAQEGTPIKTRGLFTGAVLSSFWRIISGEILDDDHPEVATLINSVTKSSSDTVSTSLCFFFPTLNKLVPSLTGYTTIITNCQIPLFKYLIARIEKRKESYEDNGQPPLSLFETYFKKMRKTMDPTSSFYGEEGVLATILTIYGLGRENVLVQILAIAILSFSPVKQMAASVMDLFLAGMETTSTTLNWIFLILALYPEIQKKLYEEMSTNIKDGLPTLPDRAKMIYTQCFLMEVNRYAAVVPLAIFHSTTQNTEVDGYKIPKETLVTPNLFGVMHDPEIWGDPEVIRPERFLTPEGEIDRHHPAYMPFSTGKRHCIGQGLAKDELFLFVTSFLQDFLVKLNPNEAAPTLEHHPGLTLSPKPHSLIFELRK